MNNPIVGYWGDIPIVHVEEIVVAEWEVIPNTGDIGQFFRFEDNARGCLEASPDGYGMVGYDEDGHGVIEYEKLGGTIRRIN